LDLDAVDAGLKQSAVVLWLFDFESFPQRLDDGFFDIRRGTRATEPAISDLPWSSGVEM
jgi:hypothetical protein